MHIQVLALLCTKKRQYFELAESHVYFTILQKKLAQVENGKIPYGHLILLHPLATI